MAYEETLRVVAQATSTMSPRGQEMMLRLAQKMPEIEGLDKCRLVFDLGGRSVILSVKEWPEWRPPSELRIRAE